MAVTAATNPAPPPPPTTGGLPPALPQHPPQDLPYKPGLRIRWANWMEDKLGKFAMPAAALGGAVLGGGLGMLTLGPVGAAVGGAGGALMGAVLFMAG